MPVMTEEEFAAAKKTFPWKHEIVSNGLGGQIFVRDRMGKEVDIFTQVGLMEKLTALMSKPPAVAQPSPEE